MSNKEIYKRVFKRGLPVAVENMIYSLVNFIDVFMVGKEIPLLGLGTAAVAGLGFANQIFVIYMVALFGLNSGAGILAAQYFGSKDYKNLKKCLGLVIVVGVAFSTLFLTGGIFFPKNLVSIFTNDSKVIMIGSKYLKIVSFSYPIIGIGFAYNMQLRAMGQTKYPFYSSLIGLFVNMFFNYVFIFGKLGFPAMGVEGAAIATIIARIISTSYVIFTVYKLKLVIAGTFEELFNISFDFFRKTLKISLPVFFHEICWAVGTSMYIGIFGRIGTEAAATVQIVKSLSGLIFTMLYGLVSATSTIIGNEIGAGNEEGAYKIAFTLLRASAIIGAIIGITVYLVSPYALIVMKVSSTIIPLAKKVMISEGILIVIKAISMQLIIGTLRAGGDTKWTMFIELVPLWFIAIPLTYFAGLKFGLPVAIVYLFTGVDDMIKIIPSYKRLKSKKWINNLVKR